MVLVMSMLDEAGDPEEPACRVKRDSTVKEDVC